MSTAQAKLKSDLVVSRQEQAAGGVAFVLKDPATSRFFRLREPEYRIVQRLDGSTPLEVVRREVEEELGASLPAETLEGFIESLRDQGLLDDPDSEPRLPHGGGRLRGSVLSLRLKAALNAVAPAGIEGVDVMDKGKNSGHYVTYGAVGVGGTKMKINHAAIQSLYHANDRVLDTESIFELGKGLA